MKKLVYKIILQILLISLIIFVGTKAVNAASAKIGASATSVEVGDNVSINVSIDAIAWNIKVDGSGISDLIVGGNLDDFANKTTNKSYNLDTSNPGTYTIKLSGDVTDAANGANSDQNGSVTITVKEKKQETPAQTEETKTTEPETPKAEEPKAEEPKTTEEQKTETPKEEKQNNSEKNTEPQVNVTDASKTMYSTDDVNVRSSYSTSSSAVGSLKKDDQVTVTGIASNGWTRIKYNGQTAYVSSQFLTDTKPKEKSNNNYLKSLKVEEASISPEFNKETTSYKISVGKDIEKIKINAEAEDEKAKVEVSGNEDLKEGANTAKVIVTAENGDAKTYTITVTKEAKGKLQLASLEINGIKLNETFKPDKYEYTANLNDNSDTKKLDIKAKANDENATIEILGNDNLVQGENVITIMVKSKDGKENVTYQIIVNKGVVSNKNETKGSANNKKNNDMFLYVAAGIFATALILIIIIIVRSIKKSREDYDEDFDNEDSFRIGNNNYTEELYSTKNENINGKNIDNNKLFENKKENDNQLYDVEKEVDFSDEDSDEYDDMPKKKKGGKHSK